MVLVATLSRPDFALIDFVTYRPVVGSIRVPPSDFAQHRVTHDFQNPCCLCAAITGVAYTESIVVLNMSGPYSGEYVGRCATNRCGYFSKLSLIAIFYSCSLLLVCLERMYTRIGLLLAVYPVRRMCLIKTSTTPMLNFSVALLGPGLRFPQFLPQITARRGRSDGQLNDVTLYIRLNSQDVLI